MDAAIAPGRQPFTYVPSTLLNCLHSLIICNVAVSCACFFTPRVLLIIFLRCSIVSAVVLVLRFLPTGRPWCLRRAWTCWVEVGRKGSRRHQRSTRTMS